MHRILQNRPQNTILSHVPHMNESCPTHRWVMSHAGPWRDAFLSPESPSECDHESCVTYDWVMSHIYISRFPRIHENTSHTHRPWMWCITPSPKSSSECDYQEVMSHIWMSHVPHMNQSCHTQALVAMYRLLQNRSQKATMRHIPHINESCPTYRMNE